MSTAGLRLGHMSRTKRLAVEGLYSIAVVGTHVGASRACIRRWIDAGLPTVDRFGRAWVHLPTLRAWMAEHRPKFKTGRRTAYRTPKGQADPSKGGIVYGLTDPRPEYADRPIRYVGQTGNLPERLRQYGIAMSTDDAHNPALGRWFAKLKRLGLTFGHVVLDECLFGVGQRERDWIKAGREKGWAMLNITDGGEGTTWTAEAKARGAVRGREVWERAEYRARWRKGSDRARAAKAGITVEELQNRRQQRAEARERNRAIAARNKQIAADREAAEVGPGPWVFVPLTYKGRAFVPLTQGKWAAVDAADWQRVSAHRWHAAYKHGSGWRAMTNVRDGGRATKTLMTRYVVSASGMDRVSVADGNPLNCVRSNLRHIKQAATISYARL